MAGSVVRGVSTEVSFIVPMDEALAIQIYPFRASSWIAMALGGLALSLSLSGIYGVLSYLSGQLADQGDRNSHRTGRVDLGGRPHRAFAIDEVRAIS
jgi:hypothetical protein